MKLTFPSLEGTSLFSTLLRDWCLKCQLHNLFNNVYLILKAHNFAKASLSSTRLVPILRRVGIKWLHYQERWSHLGSWKFVWCMWNIYLFQWPWQFSQGSSLLVAGFKCKIESPHLPPINMSKIRFRAWRHVDWVRTHSALRRRLLVLEES